MVQRVAFVGFGEVGAVFAAALCGRGVQVSAYDRLLEREYGRPVLEDRVRGGGPVRFGLLPEALRGADYVFSTVTTDVAREAAETCAPHLSLGQTWLDLNACDPQAKRDIAAILEPTGALFVEGALLGAMAVEGAQTPILVGGPHGERAARELGELGFDARFFGTEIGRAATFKMLRSVLSKGIEALLLELLVAGERAGLREELWGEIERLFGAHPFEELAWNWVCSHPRAYERRWHEMVQVQGVLRELGLEPVMTAATEAMFRRSVGLGLKEAFPKRPETPDPVIRFLERRLK